MSSRLFTVVVPTRGRETLSRCLASMASDVQPGPRPEILVVADTHSPLLADVAAICRAASVSYVEHDAGYHDWGYPQLARGYSLGSGAYLLNIGDDDIYVPGAFAAIHAAITASEPGPLFFRAELHPSPNRGNREPAVLPTAHTLEEKTITGQNLATPNVPGLIGGWSNDWHHARETIMLWGGVMHWRPELIARCY